MIYTPSKQVIAEAKKFVSNRIVPTDKHATSSTPLGNLPVPKSIIF